MQSLSRLDKNFCSNEFRKVFLSPQTISSDKYLSINSKARNSRFCDRDKCNTSMNVRKVKFGGKVSTECFANDDLLCSRSWHLDLFLSLAISQI